jgi:leucyl aminopeptidase
MTVIFKLIKPINNNTKLSVNLLDKKSLKKNLLNFDYNKIVIFKYEISFSNSGITIQIYPENDLNVLFYKNAIGAYIFNKSIDFNCSQVEISFHNNLLKDDVVFGFLQKDFLFNKYKNSSSIYKFKTNYKLSVINSAKLSSINFLKELVSEPSNILYPETFLKRVINNLNKKKISIKTLDKSKIKKLGLNCILAVSQGSSKEPKVIEFFPNIRKKNIDILFVGKGVCFDSGGISLKPSAGMEDMKWDMAGAAVTSAIIKFLSETNSNFSYAGIIGLVENMPSGNAYKPGDIIKSYKGINVEVLNTDAEGRLVLADIITYGCEIYKPKVVIDFATLTGAIMVALGQHYAGMFSNDDGLSDALYQSGIETNEKVWRMPLHDDFDKELNSSFVDLKNIGVGRYGGSVTAAQFLQRFVPPKTKWAHLDIAGTTWKNSGDILNSKGATGFGLTLIADFIDRYFKN